MGLNFKKGIMSITGSNGKRSVRINSAALLITSQLLSVVLYHITVINLFIIVFSVKATYYIYETCYLLAVLQL